MMCAAMCASAFASGPRWYTGPPYYTTAGQPVMFYTPTPEYFTDPGALSASVTHAQADAMVSAAAAIWNVPTSLLVLGQGGELNEHVSSANSYFDGSGVVFPADVQASNFQARPIAILYDTDGSVTDLLLGSGASDPSGCRQNGVTESVDAIDPAGFIDHAVIVLNGRCVAATDSATIALQLTQMQYQLMRAFGRVVGIAWSQLNDDVFTGTPTPTAAHQLAWPVMHPIDIVCGPYTFQCMRNPFTLRMDDLASLALLYPVTTQNIVAGKTLSMTNAIELSGTATFPNGQGMEMMNVSFLRELPAPIGAEPAYCVSVVTGAGFRQMNGNPVSGTPQGPAQSSGDAQPQDEGYFYAARVEVMGTLGWDWVWGRGEPINPLYSGDYAVGAYVGTPIAISGPTLMIKNVFGLPSYSPPYALEASGATAACTVSGDGTESAPAAFDPSGFLAAQICGYGHTSWRAVSVRAGHAWALEVTALDENGIATENKLQPVLGAWLSTDATGQLPTVAAVVAPMNAATVGTTQMVVPAAASDATLRLAIADMRGAGRPDFAYTARAFYADSVSPAQVSTDGGTITVQGMGFRLGNSVTVNGVAAVATNWTANSITATVPSMSAAGGSDGVPVNVAVTDLTTGAVATVPAAFAYSSAVNPVRSVTTATATQYLAAGNAAGWTMRVTAMSDGAPAAGVTVNWTGTNGAQVGAATSVTDATGTAMVSVATGGLASGAVATVQACAWTTQCVSAAANGVDPSQWSLAATSGAGQQVSVGATLAPVVLAVTDGAGHPLESAPVQVYQTVTAWEGNCTSARCPAAPVLASVQSAAMSDAGGTVTITPLQVAATAGTTNMAVATGTQGFVTLTDVVR